MQPDVDSWASPRWFSPEHVGLIPEEPIHAARFLATAWMGESAAPLLYPRPMQLRLLLLALSFAATAARAQFDIEESHTTASLRGIHNVGAGVAWASGTNGTVLRTEDGGYLWQTCTIPPGAEKLDFRGIQAFDANTAIVMSSGPGDQSRLYKTTDGCQTWKLLFTNPDKEGFWDALVFNLQEPTHPSSDWKAHARGFLVGDPVDGKFVIYSSNDSGQTWHGWSNDKLERASDCSERRIAFRCKQQRGGGYGHVREPRLRHRRCRGIKPFPPRLT